MGLKHKAFRDKNYGRWINQTLTCCITGTPNPDPHHIIGHGYSAMGTKAPDHLQMALSHALHLELHQHGWKAFEHKYGYTQKELVAMTIGQAHALGRLDIAELSAQGHIPDWLLNELVMIGKL